MNEWSIESRGAVEVWTILGESRRNVLTKAMVAELGTMLDALKGRPQVRAVAVTGAGEKAFCAGADLKERAAMSLNEVRSFLRTLNETLRNIEKARPPFIAALNGAAFGGGLELALACDIRIAASRAELGLPEVKLGVLPGAGGTQRLAAVIGMGRAKDMVLSGRRVEAEEALAWGLVNRIADARQLKPTAIAYAESIAANAPLALGAAKRAINEGVFAWLDSGLAKEAAAYESILTSEDRLEGLRAFQDKREPRYLGR
ncbi:MAG: enoyl-CoA hydratase-related protein [Myxococcaceae bacterium]